MPEGALAPFETFDSCERPAADYKVRDGVNTPPRPTLLIYGLAFETGIAHPESLIEDRPSAFAGYVPSNFDRGFQGTVKVRRALALSLNVPAVQLLDAVGPARRLARMRRAGAAPRLAVPPTGRDWRSAADPPPA